MLHSDSWEQFKIKDIASIGRGRVISSIEISQQENPLYPVYSSQTSNEGIMGYLDNFMFEGEYISWTTDGANAGTVFYRNGKFNCTNVCGLLKLRNGFDVSIRSTTGIKPLYTTIATVTMNLIVSAAIVLLNPYVTVYISYKIPPFALSVHIPDVSTSIYVEVDSKVLLGLPFCDKASGRLHHSGTPLGLHRVPYR